MNGKQNMVYPHKGTLCCNLGELQHYAKWRKPHSVWFHLYEISRTGKSVKTETKSARCKVSSTFSKENSCLYVPPTCYCQLPSGLSSLRWLHPTALSKVGLLAAESHDSFHDLVIPAVLWALPPSSTNCSSFPRCSSPLVYYTSFTWSDLWFHPPLSPLSSTHQWVTMPQSPTPVLTFSRVSASLFLLAPQFQSF